MTEIGKISNVAQQVADLRASAPAKPSSNDVDRLSGTPAPESGQSTDLSLQLVGPSNPNDPASEASPLERAAEALQQFLPREDQSPNTRLRIDKDDATGRFVYKNIDAESGEVIRQFPPESILEFLSYYREVAGLAVDDEA